MKRIRFCADFKKFKITKPETFSKCTDACWHLNLPLCLRIKIGNLNSLCQILIHQIAKPHASKASHLKQNENYAS